MGSKRHGLAHNVRKLSLGYRATDYKGVYQGKGVGKKDLVTDQWSTRPSIRGVEPTETMPESTETQHDIRILVSGPSYPT